MKIIIGLIALVGISLFLLLKKKSSKFEMNASNAGGKPESFLSIKDGNQDSLIIKATITQDWLNALHAKYNWDTYNEYDNIMWEYMDALFDDPVEKSGIKDSKELWNKLTHQQKLFWAFLVFNGDTNNGGVYQFIHNKPEFIFAASEMWNELQMNQLKKDYEEVLVELIGYSGNIEESKVLYNDKFKTWKVKIESFAKRRKELKSTDKIEEYYYNKEFKKNLHKKVADFIEGNIEKFAVVK